MSLYACPDMQKDKRGPRDTLMQQDKRHVDAAKIRDTLHCEHVA